MGRRVPGRPGIPPTVGLINGPRQPTVNGFDNETVAHALALREMPELVSQHPGKFLAGHAGHQRQANAEHEVVAPQTREALA